MFDRRFQRDRNSWTLDDNAMIVAFPNWSRVLGLMLLATSCDADGSAIDAAPIYDARWLSVGETCDGASDIICLRDAECFDPPSLPDPCTVSWRSSCCDAAGICDEPTDTTQAQLDVCIADLAGATCADLMQYGLPEACLGIGEPL